MATENYTLGRGELHLAKRDPITKVLGGYRFIGNVPEFSLAVSTEKLEHFRSTRGVREKDLTITLQTNRTGTMTAEDISVENLSLFFLGTSSLITQASASGLTQALPDVVKGYNYQIGVTNARPTGYRNLTTPVLSKAGSPLVNLVDYSIDATRGIVYILPGGAVVDGDDLSLSFGVGAVTRKQTISGSTTTEGALKFLAYPAEGDPVDYFMPSVEVSPNGDFSLISENTLQSIPLTIDIQASSPLEAIYMDGAPYVPG